MNDVFDATWVISLIGGVFILLAGIFVALLGEIFRVMMMCPCCTTAMYSWFSGPIIFFGVAGIIFGVIVIVFAQRMRNNPSNHTWAVLVMIFSLLNFIGAGVGFIIGAVLVGGILGLTWKNSTPQQPPPPAQQ
jgi:uncharacterized membrane protein